MSVSTNSNEPKINIIPLMDVIFIFIFFLLMSVQFFEYFQITSSNPITKTPQQVPPEPDKKPKQFKLQVGKDTVEFTEGMEEKVLATFKNDEADILKLRAFMKKIKDENPDENSMIIKPYRDIDFARIVGVIDAVQQKVKIGVDATGSKKFKLLFKNIAFEARE